MPHTFSKRWDHYALAGVDAEAAPTVDARVLEDDRAIWTEMFMALRSFGSSRVIQAAVLLDAVRDLSPDLLETIQ